MERDNDINNLYRHSLWKDCSSPNADFLNTTFLFNLLRTHMKCGKGEVKRYENQDTSRRACESIM
jgi:hypothetical protein